jgi:hypothetical protein
MASTSATAEVESTAEDGNRYGLQQVVFHGTRYDCTPRFHGPQWSLIDGSSGRPGIVPVEG